MPSRSPAIPTDVLAQVRREMCNASPVQIAALLYEMSDDEIAQALEHDWRGERPDIRVLVRAVAIVRAGFRMAHPDVISPDELLASLQAQAKLAAGNEHTRYAQADDMRYFGRHVGHVYRVALRILVERAIVRCAVQDILAAGHAIRVQNGEGWTCPRTTELAVVMDALMASEADFLHVFGPQPDRERVVSFNYGNHGWDVIGYWPASLEHLLAGAEALAERLADLL